MFTTFFPENRDAYVEMWKKLVEPDKSHMTIWRMRFAHWITKSTDSHCKYVILTHFPW